MNKDYQSRRFTISIPDKGSVTAEAYEMEDPVAVIALAHGAGSNLDQPFLQQIAAALATKGFAVIRYNFLYTELRKKMPDRFPVAATVISTVIAYCHQHYGDTPLFCSGKSFGGRMSSMTLAESPELDVRGIIFFGFPLHPADNPSVARAEHLRNIRIPMLFLQGTRDALAYHDLITSVTRALPLATQIDLQGADHSFKGGKQTSIQYLSEQVENFIRKILAV